MLLTPANKSYSQHLVLLVKKGIMLKKNSHSLETQSGDMAHFVLQSAACV